jgi:hypothetical protein
MTEHPLAWEPSPDDIDRYRHHGYLVLRDAFDPAPLMNVSVDADIAFGTCCQCEPRRSSTTAHRAGIATASSTSPARRPRLRMTNRRDEHHHFIGT